MRWKGVFLVENIAFRSATVFWAILEHLYTFSEPHRILSQENYRAAEAATAVRTVQYFRWTSWRILSDLAWYWNMQYWTEEVLLVQCITEASERLTNRLRYRMSKASYWGRILRRNWDKSLKSFPPCYSQSPTSTNGFYSPHWDRYPRVSADRENWNWAERRR